MRPLANLGSFGVLEPLGVPSCSPFRWGVPFPLRWCAGGAGVSTIISLIFEQQ